MLREMLDARSRVLALEPRLASRVEQRLEQSQDAVGRVRPTVLCRPLDVFGPSAVWTVVSEVVFVW
jgi:hypothetical protein